MDRRRLSIIGSSVEAARNRYNTTGDSAAFDDDPTDLNDFFRSQDTPTATGLTPNQRRLLSARRRSEVAEAELLEQDRRIARQDTRYGGRDGPYPDNSRLLSPGSSTNESIDHTRRDVQNSPSPHASMTNPTVRERGSLEPLPRWQPDHEVSACPVCNTAFSFFFRKHHCRKCGRVVCNNCSPHRITIPRQYVVQPPSSDGNEVSEAYPARNLGGGEVVRVCNPCVPDPWTPEGAREAAAQPRPREIRRESTTTAEAAARSRQRYNSNASTRSPLPPPAGRMRAQTHQPPPTTPPPNFSSSVPQSRPLIYSRHPPDFPVDFGGRRPIDREIAPFAYASSSRPRPTGHRHTQSSAHAPPPYQTYDTRARPLSAAVAAESSSPQQQPPPYRQRREVREEDECPVCGEELPPGEDTRAAHVEECIRTRFGTPTQPSNLPPDNNNAASPPPAGGRPRGPSYRPRGIAIYRATEKDCLDASGEAVECVICFEEFQPGDEMGRMECLCKFHRACIRRWCEQRGVVSCPTHQLQQD